MIRAAMTSGIRIFPASGHRTEQIHSLLFRVLWAASRVLSSPLPIGLAKPVSRKLAAYKTPAVAAGA